MNVFKVNCKNKIAKFGCNPKGNIMRAILVLEDGFFLEGESFTGEIEFTAGVIVCNTNMGCYQEMLTEPAYHGQLLCMTWPLVGNYGINDDMESAIIQAGALITKECCKEPSNWRSVMSLPQFLMRHKVAGIEGIDTRALTVHLREHGAMRGAISTKNLSPKDLVERIKAVSNVEGVNLAKSVSTKTPYTWEKGKAEPASLNADGSYAWKTKLPHVVVYDYGVKWSNLRLLTENKMEVLVVPSSFDKKAVDALKPSGVFFSDGPGDPSAMVEEAKIAKEVSDAYPSMGTGIGFQILAKAYGAKTKAMKRGNHGVNIPVRAHASGRVHISAQNHRFCVDIENAKELKATHVGLNDDTLQGFKHVSKPICAVQHEIAGAFGENGQSLLVEDFYNAVSSGG